MYRRAARHNAAVEWRLVRAECYVCAVDVGVGECAGLVCVCVCVVGRVCVRFGGSGGVCVQCLQKRGRGHGDDGTRDPRCEVRTDVG